MTKEIANEGNNPYDIFNPNIDIEELLESTKQDIIRRYKHKPTTRNEIKVLEFDKVIGSKNKSLNKMKDNVEFEKKIIQLRQKYKFEKERLDYVLKGEIDPNTRKLITNGDYYYSIHRFNFDYFSLYRDENITYIKGCITELYENREDRQVDLDDYIIIVYFLFFDELINYESFIKVLIRNDGLNFIGPKIDITDDDYKDLESVLKEVNDIGYFQYKLKFYKQIFSKKENLEIINKFRRYMKVKENNCVENHYLNYSMFYKYLKKYSLYKSNDIFVYEILTIMEDFDEFDSRNELDYLWLLNYLIYNRALDKDINSEELICLISESSSGYDLIYNNNIELESCYVKFPVFTNSQYLNIVKSIINTDVTEIYDLPTGGKRIDNKYKKYLNNKIYNLYQDYRAKGYSGDDAIKYTIKDINDEEPGTILYKQGEDGFGEMSEYDQVKRIISYEKAKLKHNV